jgi:hypothetical protein
VPPSAPEQDQGLAVAAEVLYLTNLLLLPGLAFIALAVLYAARVGKAAPLAACHLRQALTASLWAGALLGAVTLTIALLGGFDNPATWVVLILYFVTCHATLVMLGVLGLSKAMAGRHFHYPVVGRRCVV